MKNNIFEPWEMTLPNFEGRVGDTYPVRGGYIQITAVGLPYTDDEGLVRDVEFRPVGFEPHDRPQRDALLNGVAALMVGKLRSTPGVKLFTVDVPCLVRPGELSSNGSVRVRTVFPIYTLDGRPDGRPVRDVILEPVGPAPLADAVIAGTRQLLQGQELVLPQPSTGASQPAEWAPNRPKPLL